MSKILPKMEFFVKRCDHLKFRNSLDFYLLFPKFLEIFMNF